MPVYERRLVNIVADEGIAQAAPLFAGLGKVRCLPGRAIDRSALRDCDVLLVRTGTAVDRALLDGTPVRYVASAASGIDHVDTDYLRQTGIGFVHAPGCNAQAVCEYVLSCLFCLDQRRTLGLPGLQIGLIGHGHIGARLARQLAALGLSVHVYDPFIRHGQGEAAYRFRDMEKITSCDVLSIHVPLTDSGPYPTRRLLDAAFLRRLKEDVIIINTARGAVVDEPALLDFLRRNRRARVALDVWAGEPHINTALLRRAELATPHIAGYSHAAKQQATQMIYAHLLALMGRPPPNSPAPSAPPAQQVTLTLAAAEQGAAHDALARVREAVLGGYDVRGDSARLRTAVEAAGPAAGFARLRAAYRPRRGFADVRIDLAGAPGGLPAMLRALGFQVRGFQVRGLEARRCPARRAKL